jgi:beta-phosphoglucomutase-like phosphatase (HAD superfamily)
MKPAGFRRFAGVGPPAVRSNSWQRLRPARAAASDEHPVAGHTLAFIHALAAHVPVGVASGAFREEIEHVLEVAGLSRFTAALAHINRRRSTPIVP